jgi:integrase
MKTRNQRTKIYSTENIFIYESGHDSYSLEGRLDGKRIRQRAKTLEEAKAKAHSLEEGREEEKIHRSILSQKQLRDAEAAFMTLPAGVSLVDAVSFFNENQTKQGAMSIEDAVWKILETKEGKSLKTYEDSKSRLLRFAKWSDGKTLPQVGRSEASTFLKSVPQGSFNHYLRHCKGLYIWAMNEGLVSVNPYAHIKPLKASHSDVGILSNDESEALLDAARAVNDGELLAYVSICLFAGLRPDSEMRALTWDSINLEDAEIRVTEGKTKTPRTVDLSSNLLQWLLVCDRKKAIYPKGFRRKWAKVRQQAGFKGGAARTEKQKEAEKGLKPWGHDQTRHTAVSNKVRICGDIGKAATWAGHAVSVCSRNYLALVSSSDASTFWALAPAPCRAEALTA